MYCSQTPTPVLVKGIVFSCGEKRGSVFSGPGHSCYGLQEIAHEHEITYPCCEGEKPADSGSVGSRPDVRGGQHFQCSLTYAELLDKLLPSYGRFHAVSAPKASSVTGHTYSLSTPGGKTLLSLVKLAKDLLPLGS